MNKYQYTFEIEESINGNLGVVEVESLESALRRVHSGGIIHAKYGYFIEDRYFWHKIDLLQEDIIRKTESEIYEHLDNQVDSIRFQNQ